MNRLYRLLAYGYFPKELPPVFSTRLFAKHTYDLSDIEAYASSKWQRPSPYLLQQKPHYRRQLDILGPQSILRQAYVISENYDVLQAMFPKFDGNCSRPAFNRRTKYYRAVRPFAIGRGYAQRKLELRSRFPLILKLDVKNYYRSIYTHSIPWALHGKGYAKTHLREDNLGNNIDRAIQQGQDGQTVGIPTGPDTSFIISELILSKIIEKMTNDRLIKSDRCVRYYDDIQYGCESEEDAHRILASFENALRDYELEVNPDKVLMISGPSYVESPWPLQLRGLEWQEGVRTDLLIEIFSFVAEMAQRYSDDHIFRYFLRKMRTVIVAEDAWNAYQRILLSLLQENRGNAKEVFEQFSYYQRIGRKVNKKALKEALDRKVRHQLSRGVTSELSWAIYGYLLFDVQMSKDLAKNILQKADASSKVLVTKLIFDRNMALKSDVNGIIKDWGEDVLNSSEWLFAYEVLVNRWHNRYSQVPLPENADLFEHLKDNKVSFLDDSGLLPLSLPDTFRRYLPSPETEGQLDVADHNDFIASDNVESDSSDEDVDETGYS